MLPPEAWEGTIVGNYYWPRKQPVTVRVDADVTAWLRSKSGGHLTRINEILRRVMVEEALAKQH